MKGKRKKCPECGQGMDIERFIPGYGKPKISVWWCPDCGAIEPFSWSKLEEALA